MTVHLEQEDSYFKKKDAELIRNLREKTEAEARAEYRQTHRSHCFRCGTASLAEVDHGKVKVDVCVNKGCGAMHLDPGELDEILKDQGSLTKVRKALLAIFE